MSLQKFIRVNITDNEWITETCQLCTSNIIAKPSDYSCVKKMITNFGNSWEFYSCACFERKLCFIKQKKLK